jgi:DNA-binding NarL/FixJ family response regulator
MLPFFTARGYVADGAANGEEALEQMRTAPRHVLLVELDLGDVLLADLLDDVRNENLAGAVILLDDPAKSGLIVATLLRGVDGYVATPPDENYLFRLVDRQLLAQWALAQGELAAPDTAELKKAEKNLDLERGKVKELVKEIASLREELHRAKTAKPEPKPMIPGFGPANAKAEIEEVLDDASGTFDPEMEDFDEATAVGQAMTKQPPPITAVDVAKTLPSRKAAPAHLATPPGATSGFDDVPMTKPAMSSSNNTTQATAPVKLPAENKPAEKKSAASIRGKAPTPAPAAATIEEPSESDLLLDIEKELDEDTSEVPLGTAAQQKKGNRFLLTPDED